MAKPLLLEFAHALYPATSRGDRREDIYYDDADRAAWLAVLAQVCKRFNWRVRAYYLMSNHYHHYHLLVETPDANLSAGMRLGHLAEHFGLHYTSVSRIVNRQEKA